MDFPLQILASKIAAFLLPIAGVPVLRKGNVIHLPAMSLEVAEVCSGIRSLLSLATLAIIYGCLVEIRISIRVVFALASIPIAVAANSGRVVGTGLLIQYWGPDKAEGFFHAFSGWLVFVVLRGDAFSPASALTNRPRTEWQRVDLRKLDAENHWPIELAVAEKTFFALVPISWMRSVNAVP